MRRNFIAALAAVLMFAMTAGSAFALNAAETNVVSPYWQADSGVYTFVGITHPSMAGMASQIGLVVTALQTDGSTPTGASTALEFTVTGNTTTKIFIVLTNNTSINPTNIPTAKFISILSTTGQSGAIYIQPKASNPEVDTSSEASAVSGGLQRRSVNMLSVWGAVVVQSTSTGFAMDWIGDSQSSSYMSQAVSSVASGTVGTIPGVGNKVGVIR